MYRFLTGCVLVAALPLMTEAALAEQSFDGHWNIQAVPEKGACKRTHQYKLVIENGTIRSGASKMVRGNVTGGLQPDGRIQGSVQRNRTRIDVTGNLSGSTGSGEWATSGRVTCSGRWSAEKQG